MKTLFNAALLAAALAFTGCEVEVNESVPPTDTSDGVNVDVDTPAEIRAERREERHETIRDAVDKVDVEVNDGGVKVDVDGE